MKTDRILISGKIREPSRNLLREDWILTRYNRSRESQGNREDNARPVDDACRRRIGIFWLRSYWIPLLGIRGVTLACTYISTGL